jgi:3-deoxy-D-manno-octulosonic acid kinase
VRAFAWAGAADWLTSVLSRGETLHVWSGRCAADVQSGRGPVHVVEAPVSGPDGAHRWAVRHYHRGGAAAPLLGDRYWGHGRTRPERELEASVYARARGVRTPAVVGGAVYRTGSSGAAGFYRADLVTELVPGARSLTQLLGEGRAATQGLRRAGALVRALERAGVLHPDLNASNVTLDEAGRAWVVDLDRARRFTPPSARAAEAMLTRLERSIRKLGGPLSVDERRALRAGFEESA